MPSYRLGMQLGHISRNTGNHCPSIGLKGNRNGGKGKVQEKDRKTYSLGETEVASKHAVCRHRVQIEQDLFTCLFWVETTAGLRKAPVLRETNYFKLASCSCRFTVSHAVLPAASSKAQLPARTLVENVWCPLHTYTSADKCVRLGSQRNWSLGGIGVSQTTGEKKILKKEKKILIKEKKKTEITGLLGSAKCNVSTVFVCWASRGRGCK